MTDWSLAECRKHDAEMWYPKGYSHLNGLEATEAKRICKEECPIRADCLEVAMADEAGRRADYCAGIFGGLDEVERHALATGVTAQPYGGLQPHGTLAARKRHKRAGEPFCALCQPTRVYRKRAAA